MEQFRASADAFLIVPTATMAEHVRNELARSGYPVRPSRVGTLAHFIERIGASAKIPPAPPAALLYLLIARALEELKPAQFEALRESRGLHDAIAHVMEELPEPLPRGRDSEGGFGGSEDLFAIVRLVRAELHARGFALRNARLRAAADLVRSGVSGVPNHVVWDGFFTLGYAELDLIDALTSRAAVTVTLPESPGAAKPRVQLERAGFAVRRFAARLRRPDEALFCAPTREREAEEIARRILDYAARGRKFREMGIVLRARDPFAPLIETTLARFGIPTRAYFAEPLSAHPAVAFLSGIVKTLLGGFDHAAIASLLRMPVSGMGATPAGDEFDFDLRKNLPGRGPVPTCPLPIFEALDSWRSERHSPQVWAEKLSSLRRLIPQPEIPLAPADRDQIYVWRSTAAALSSFEEVIGTTATCFDPLETVALAEFWPHVETALSLEMLRVDDRRRDVVHVMDVFEARQWELPIVFVCGLLERVFPQYHREDPLLGDTVRARLGMSTAAQRQQEEYFLFEMAASRAAEETVLSYSRYDEKGGDTVRSFFLGEKVAVAVEEMVRPAPSRTVAVPVAPEIRDPVLMARLEKTHRKLSPSNIETFLQCPFQFFARRTLALRERPPAPRDRLTPLMQGQIIHRALAEWARFPLLGAQVLNRVFEEECAALRVPETYRTEAVRLELLRYFEAFLANPGLPPQANARIEEKFKFELRPGVAISGRIDRLDVAAGNNAIVIDYKYSAGNKIRDFVGESEEGNRVQAGLYMLAAERVFGLVPAGMLYCGLKKDMSWGGWHLAIAGLERIGTSCLPETLRELMTSAEQSALQVHEAITSGAIAVKPRDEKKCDWCDYRDTCRVETISAERSGGAAG
jgi:RecB family exonuclease